MVETEALPVREARAGDPGAWDTLFRRFQLPLYAYVFEMVHDEQGSLDIVQETFINATRHINSLRADARFASWLFGIAHQKCVQRWRKRYREERALEELEEQPWEPADDPADLLMHEEQRAAFLKAIEQLPLPQRSVLLLHFLEDFSLEEIAAATGTQLGTVKSRLHYAKKALKQLLKDQD